MMGVKNYELVVEEMLHSVGAVESQVQGGQN